MTAEMTRCRECDLQYPVQRPMCPRCSTVNTAAAALPRSGGARMVDGRGVPLVSGATLAACRDCGRQVSVSAGTCPNCGALQPSATREVLGAQVRDARNGYIAAVVIALLLAFAIVVAAL